LGIIPTDEALRRAFDKGLDLVEVAPTERPPVCRIMDFGKWKYQQGKQKHKAKPTHEAVLKEVRLRPKTDQHDRKIKIDRASRFLEKGDKVQFTMIYRGRERFHQDIGYEIFQAILSEFGEKVKVERAPKMEGRRMTMILAPAKVKV